MNLKHQVHMAIVLPAIAALAACGGSSSNNNAQTCPETVGNLAVTEIAADQCQVGGTLVEDATLAANVTWFLEGRLQVGDNGVPTTLDIDAGTQIRGDGTDHVLVYPGSALQANGTGANPVQFLSDDDGVDGSGEWGGVFLRGFNGLPTLTGTQGANDLDYVVVAEAGASVSITIDGGTVTYQDNIVLNGVDSNTTLTFVQSHNSARDGFHILNGDPRMSWLLATGSARDGVWYRDFNGLIKDLMVIHNQDSDGSTGRSGIYASESTPGNGDGDSNPRIVNATLVGRDTTTVAASADTTANEFGILFADNSDQIRMANVLIANFRNGCFEADENANLSGIDTSIPGPTYLDGVHCANETGALPGEFGIVRATSTGFPNNTVATPNSPNADGIVYYNGTAGEIGTTGVAGNQGNFNPAAGGINFTGEIADRSGNFTAGWYLDNLRGIGNGLVANSNFLNGFLDGNTNIQGADGSLTPMVAANNVVDASDTNSPFIINGNNAFNLDVADDTGGYDMTHVGAVRSGNPANASQFDGWTVATGDNDGFAVQQVQ